MPNEALLLLQLFDSSFPTGAYTQSFGLETYVQEGIVVDGDSLFDYLCTYLCGPLLHTDALAFRLAYESSAAGRMNEVWALDGLLMAQSLAREAREGARRMGERLIRLMAELFPQQSVWTAYRECLRERQAFGHPALVYGLAVQQLGIDPRWGVAAYLYACVNAQVQNGVRAIPLGQTEGQRILLKLHPWIEECAEDVFSLGWEDFGAVSPGLELAQMRHERLDVRMFMS